MLKKIKTKIESERNSKNLFWKSLVFGKDFVRKCRWFVHNLLRRLWFVHNLRSLRIILFWIKIRYYNKYNRITLSIPKRLQPPLHHYSKYGGPWIESYFYEYFMRNKPKLDRIYIPIFWTNIFDNSRPNPPKQILQKFIGSLDHNKRYFTISHNDGGVEQIMGKSLPKNVFHFNAGGVGDIPIPLITPVIPNLRQNIKSKKRDTKVSFMGKLNGANDRTGVRSKMYEVLKNEKGYYFGYGDIKNFVDTTSRSVFTLCPRGYGRTSYRLYEAIALGSIPIYIWDDIEWLPYKDKLNWEDFSISINIKDIKKLPSIINSHNSKMIKQKQEKIKELYDKYFTMEGTCKQIIRMLKEEKC